MSLYHEGSRELQDRFDPRRIADRLDEANVRIFLNSPRHLHHLELREYSAYAPRAGHAPPVPDWKRRPEYRDHLPARDRAALAAEPTGEEPS